MTAAEITPANTNNLQLQKSFDDYQQQLKELSHCAWQIAYTALWNSSRFSEAETEMAKIYISSFLQQGKHHKTKYSEFVQRVLLARLYVSSHPGKYIPLPSQWFCDANVNGFAGTEKWYKAMQQTRLGLPLYKDAIKWFAEAVLQTCSTNEPKNFHYWRSYFIDQKANGLLNLYLSAIANISLGSK